MPSAIRHFVLAFLIAALIFGVVGALGLGWFGKAVREKEKNHITDTTEDEKEDGTGEDQTGQEGRPSLRGQSFSMLLILNDYQPDRYSYDTPDNYQGIIRPRLRRADSLIYLRFSRETAKLYISVIPTDTKLTVDGVTMSAAEAYHYKDGSYLANRLSLVLGVNINYYIDARYDEFVSFVNSAQMNGITLDISEEIKLTLRSGTSVTLQQGTQYLDGERALALLRSGGVANKQLYNEIHIQFAMAMLEKLTTLENKRNPSAFYGAVLANLKNNLPESQFVSNTDMVFAYFDLEKEALTVPGAYDESGYFVVNTEEAKAIFRTGTVVE